MDNVEKREREFVRVMVGRERRERVGVEIECEERERWWRLSVRRERPSGWRKRKKEIERVELKKRCFRFLILKLKLL